MKSYLNTSALSKSAPCTWLYIIFKAIAHRLKQNTILCIIPKCHFSLSLR